jgi:hypothetical protein
MVCYFVGVRREGQPRGESGSKVGAAAGDEIRARRDVPPWMLCAICLIQPIVIAALHVLPGEAARLYAFMYPLMLVPVGLELARWPRRDRVIAFACLWLLGAAVLRNMTFI